LREKLITGSGENNDAVFRIAADAIKRIAELGVNAIGRRAPYRGAALIMDGDLENPLAPFESNEPI
jgi:hypothetical protein